MNHFPGLMDIRQATKAYEAWLGRHMPLIPADLKLKHQRMAESVFGFLRATFYRWKQLWREVCPELATTPQVLGVGDLHVENFGTWRDCEGRLVWGVNDFDEACRIPYCNDLVRLAVSAHLAVKENQLSCDLDSICEAILGGYQEAIQHGGRPFVLAEQHHWLRQLAISDLRDPLRFWQKLAHWRSVGRAVPTDVENALGEALPERRLAFRMVHRQAGLGSLGRRRFTALAEWRGGLVAREAKELAPSAWYWEGPDPSHGKLLYPKIIQQAARVADPFVGFQGRWLIRRLAPDCSRIELASPPDSKDELKLLHVMGWETANIHVGDRKAAQRVRQDLRRRPTRWLLKATAAMAQATMADWEKWRRL